MPTKAQCKRGHLFDKTNTYVDPSGHRQCKECRRQRGKAWLKNKSIDKQFNATRKARRAATYRRTTYGLTGSEFNAMLEKQQGVCAICRQVQSLVVDHDHSTGKVRGLLCGKCNRGLGLFNDNPRTLKDATRYVRKKL